MVVHAQPLFKVSPLRLDDLDITADGVFVRLGGFAVEWRHAATAYDAASATSTTPHGPGCRLLLQPWHDPPVARDRRSGRADAGARH